MPDLASLAVSVALVLSGAGWAQSVGSPIAWPRSHAGYVDRVEDLAGARLVAGVTQGSLNLAYGWRPYAAVCVRERLISCSFERTFTGFDRYGIRRINYPLIAGILVSSTAAVAWRPERFDPVKAMMFASARVATGTAGAVAGRALHDWWATRPVRVDSLPPDSLAQGETAGVSQFALTTGLIVAGAAGAQLVKSPEEWPQTLSGFGQRVADQTGFYVVQQLTYRGLGAATGLRTDARVCPRDQLIRCSATRTFTALDVHGNRRAHVPLITSIGVATAASVFWRPERFDSAKTWSFVGTRLGIVVGGFLAERVVVDWLANRRMQGTTDAH